MYVYVYIDTWLYITLIGYVCLYVYIKTDKPWAFLVSVLETQIFTKLALST